MRNWDDFAPVIEPALEFKSLGLQSLLFICPLCLFLLAQCCTFLLIVGVQEILIEQMLKKQPGNVETSGVFPTVTPVGRNNELSSH